MDASVAWHQQEVPLPVRGRQSRAARLWIIAFVLWIASNLFVTGVATLATWEGDASYRRMADLCHWDCTWYGSVVEGGYSKAPKANAEVNWPFHPLFPITAYPLHKWFKLSLHGSVVLAGKLELLLAIYAFMLLLSDEAEMTSDYYRAGALVAFNPYIIYAHAGYAEPLYFSLIALAFYFARRSRWIASGAMGGLASATRLVGFLFSISYAVFWAREGSWRSRIAKADLGRTIGLLLCPLGAAIFTLYMYHLTGDALVQKHIQVAWEKVPGNPIHILKLSLLHPHWQRVWGVMVIASLLLSAWLVKLGKAEMGIFLALSVLMPVSASIWAAPRYIWWQPPFLYAVYRLLRRNETAWLTYSALAAGFAAFMIVAWFSGQNFVV